MIKPSLLNFLRAIWRAARALFRLDPVLAPVPVQNGRLGECYSCVHLDPIDDQCKLCTCFVVAKAALATEECPVGKWGTFTKRNGRTGTQ
jgi:DTW domain-containing protein YfiP